MKNTELQIFKQTGLIKEGAYNFSEIANAFLSEGYTSLAGNTYLNSIRLAEGILIKESIGHGWHYTFLNGIRIYTIKDKTLVAERLFHNRVYNKQMLRNEVMNLLLNQIRDAAKSEGICISEYVVKEKINTILDEAFNEDQRSILQKQLQKHLI